VPKVGDVTETPTVLEVLANYVSECVEYGCLIVIIVRITYNKFIPRNATQKQNIKQHDVQKVSKRLSLLAQALHWLTKHSGVTLNQ